jgi:hypothetical protein
MVAAAAHLTYEAVRKIFYNRDPEWGLAVRGQVSFRAVNALIDGRPICPVDAATIPPRPKLGPRMRAGRVTRQT